MTDGVTLEAFVRKLAQTAETQFRKCGELRPFFVGDTPAGERVVFPIDIRLSKDEAAAVMRSIAAELRLVRCAFIDEMWFLQKTFADRGEADRMRKVFGEKSLADEPDRREAIVIMSEDDMGHLQGHMEILRDGGKVRLGRLIMMRPDISEGRFTGLLPPQGVPS